MVPADVEHLVGGLVGVERIIHADVVLALRRVETGHMLRLSGVGQVGVAVAVVIVHGHLETGGHRDRVVLGLDGDRTVCVKHLKSHRRVHLLRMGGGVAWRMLG